jgi:hypothetical protein
VASGGEWTQVPSFDGGLNFSVQPAAIADNEWSWCNGFYPDEGSALPLPRYTLLIPASYFESKTPAQTVFGVLMNPFSPANPLLILTYETGAMDPAPVHLYTSTGETGNTIEVTWDGVGTRPTRYQAHQTAAQSAFLDGWLVITCGSGDVGFSLFRWNGGATFATLAPAGYPTFRCAHLESFGGYLIGAAWGTGQADMRRVRISDANSTTVWLPAISNAADDLVLDDSVSGIVGMAPLNANALGVFTRVALYSLAPSGNIPPFTRSYEGMYPAADGGSKQGASHAFYVQSAPLCGATPYGLAHVGYSNVHLGLDTPIGSKIWRFLGYQIDPPVNLPRTTPRLLWHHRLRALIVPTIAHPAPNDGFFYLNPLTQAWGWQNSTHVPLGRDHALIYLGTGVGVPTWTHIVVNEAGDIYGEYPPMNPRPGIYVDTKDFAMPADRYIDAIKVDWEPLFPGTILKVSCLAREGINDGVTDGPVFGTIGFEQNLSNLFAHVPACQQCELSPGGSENALRARGKYNRFRFEVLGGLARIRGFAFRQSMASDRLTNVRIIVTPIDRGVWDQTGWDQSNWNAN